MRDPLDAVVLEHVECPSATLAVAVHTILLHFLPDAGYVIGYVPTVMVTDFVAEGLTVRQLLDALAEATGCECAVTNQVIAFELVEMP